MIKSDLKFWGTSGPIAQLVLIAFVSTGCNLLKLDSLSTQRSESVGNGVELEVSVNEDGASSAFFDTSLGQNQAISASDDTAVAGSSLAIPSNALSESAEISMAEGANLTADDSLSELSVTNSDVAASSAAVMIESNGNEDPLVPMSLSLPKPEGLALLELDDANLVVIFRIVIKKTGERKAGLIPAKFLTISGDSVKLDVAFFGIYQVVYLNRKIEERVEQATQSTVVSRKVYEKVEQQKAASAPLVVADKNEMKFLAVAVGASRLRTVVFTNKGERDATDFKITGGGNVFLKDGTDCKITLTAGASCSVTFKFVPEHSQAYESVVTADYAGGDPVKISAKGLGVVKASLSLASSGQSGATAFGSTKDVVYTITNSGGIAATDLSFTHPSGPFGHHGGNCSAVLAAGATCTYKVRFISPGNGTYTSSVGLSFNDGSANQTVSTTLSLVGEALAVSVGPAYPGHGANWNDYVDYSDTSKDRWHQNDVGCNLSKSKWGDCVHGGTKKKVATTELSSCAGLKVSDALGVFNWECVEEDGGVSFYSHGFHGSKGLKDLIHVDADGNPGWAKNQIKVEKNQTKIIESGLAVWWGNAVGELPDSTGSSILLSTQGKVFVLTTSANTKGYNIDADKISLVTLEGARLKAIGDDLNTSVAGEPASTGLSAMIAAGGQSYLWIEVGLDGESYTTSGYGIYLSSVDSSVIRNSAIYNQNFMGIKLDDKNKSILLQNIRISKIKYSEGAGIYIGSNDHTVQNINVSNAKYGLKAESAAGLSVTKVVATHTLEAVKLNTATNSTLSHLTLVNNNTAGIKFETGSNGIAISSVLAVNNNAGFNVEGTGKFWNTLSTNGTYGYSLGGSASTVFHGYLGVGFNSETNCFAASANLGLVQGTCSDSGTDGETSYGTTSSDAKFYGGIDLPSVFVGKVSGDDKNQQGSSGTASAAGIVDYGQFENHFRNWGLEGSVFPDATNRGRCGLEGQSCQLWDFRLSSSSSKLLNKSGDGINQNEAFSPGQNCPSAVDGGLFIEDEQSPSNKYLINAVEIIGDAYGDEDGLCESGEACIYAPNVGAYHGHGGLKAGSCVFNGAAGGVTDVIMVGFEDNGA